MDKKKATDFIQKLLVSNEDKKPEEQLQRKDIVDILVVDHKIPESSAYRYYADSLREYEWEQEKSGDPTRIDKNKKVLDQVWDIAQNYKLVEKDDDRFLQTIQIWSKLSTRFKKLGLIKNLSKQFMNLLLYMMLLIVTLVMLKLSNN